MPSHNCKRSVGRPLEVPADAPGFNASHVWPPHWIAIASAIPGYVRDLFFHLSGPGGSRCTRGVRPVTIWVGTRHGSPLSHRHVAFVSGCPYCHGWIIWSGFRIRLLMTLTGFSSAILGIGESQEKAHKVQRLSLLLLFPVKISCAAYSQVRAGGMGNH